MGGELESEGVEPLRQIANVLEEIVIGNEGRNGGEESGGGGDERFGDAGSHGTETGSTGAAEAGKGVNDAPDGAEETDERSNARGGGEPGHALFNATDFIGGGELHADGDGLKRLKFWRRGIAGAAELRLEFAVAGGVDVGEGRAGGDDSLGIGDTLGGAKDFKELVALAGDAAEQAKLLKDQSPGDQ